MLWKNTCFDNKSYGTSSEEDIQERLPRAKVGFEHANSRNDDTIIVDENMQKAFDELKKYSLELFIYRKLWILSLSAIYANSFRYVFNQHLVRYAS